MHTWAVFPGAAVSTEGKAQWFPVRATSAVAKESLLTAAQAKPTDRVRNEGGDLLRRAMYASLCLSIYRTTRTFHPRNWARLVPIDRRFYVDDKTTQTWII